MVRNARGELPASQSPLGRRRGELEKGGDGEGEGAGGALCCCCSVRPITVPRPSVSVSAQAGEAGRGRGRRQKAEGKKAGPAVTCTREPFSRRSPHCPVGQAPLSKIWRQLCSSDAYLGTSLANRGVSLTQAPDKSSQTEAPVSCVSLSDQDQECQSVDSLEPRGEGWAAGGLTVSQVHRSRCLECFQVQTSWPACKRSCGLGNLLWGNPEPPVG